MNSGIDQTAEEIVTEIAMSASTKPWLILEGVSDERLLLTRNLANSPKLLVAFGWENVVSVIEKVKEEAISDVAFGLIDRDYREYLGISISNDRIVQTDYKDIEVTLFHSKAFNRILIEQGSKDKLPRLKNGETNFEQIKETICKISTQLGQFRIYCQKKELPPSFTSIDFTRFLDPKTLEITPDKLISHINGKSQNTVTIQDWHESQKIPLPEEIFPDHRFITNGHDLLAIFGQSLRKKWGSRNSKEVEGEKIEGYFRIGFSNEEFEQTAMFTQLNSLLSS